MPGHERDSFLKTWERENLSTMRVLDALPADQYDFRPDPGGRSLGELAWHLAEAEAYMTYGIEQGKFDFAIKPPNLERPRDVRALAAGFRRAHEDAMARVRRLTDEDFDRTMPFFMGDPMRVGDILWYALLHHLIHHRGQLALMCRLAGGRTPGIHGPNREEMAALKAQT
ncbi:MAG: DinB family protein [Candidatus Eisenbacteria bacterium]|nr:DinB family protein [Candidatus Eisenbacteria bacterium]